MFDTKNEYIFNGPLNLIERNPNVFAKTYNCLGRFITYKSVVYHGDIYHDGKAEFEFGTINSGHYNFVEKEDSTSSSKKTKENE